MRKHPLFFVPLMALALVVSAPVAQAADRDLGFLTAPAAGDPVEIGVSYVRQARLAAGYAAQDVAGLAVRHSYTTRHNGVTHVYLQQRHNGLEIVSSNVHVNVARDGRVINTGGRMARNLASSLAERVPALDGGEAIGHAAEHLGLRVSEAIEARPGRGLTDASFFTGGGISRTDIPVRLVYVSTDGGLRLAWDMVIHQRDPDNLWNVWVDAGNGELLGRNSWTAADSYEVFAHPEESPNDGGRTIEVDPADSTASPFGWHDTNGAAGAEFTTTRGNNVCAQEDRDGNNSACGTGLQPDGGGSLDFNGATVPLNLAQAPGDYQEAAVANLFYWNNVIHDILFQYGFDEASGNFQETNYSGQGAGGDSVNADAQDNADGNPPSTNNANFATPPEGGPFNPHPRMQMFEWTPPNLNQVVVDAPSSAAGNYDATDASFGPALSTTGVSGDLVVVDDGTGTSSDGCEALINGGAVSGNVAIADRGSCSFVTKVRTAQNAGAVGVIVVNNAAGTPIGLGDDGTGGDITIPSGMVSLADGNTIKSGLPATGTLRRNPSPPPNRDSDLDAGIIAHEYCHGLSNRLTGGPTDSGCLSGSQQAGEGWSDLCTLFLTPDQADTGATPRGVGTYSVFEPSTGAGIRPFPYSTDMGVNPQTYGDLAGGTLSVPHGVGTVWAMAGWEMYWALTDDQGFDPDLYAGTGGNNVAIRLIVDGLKLQPCDPTMLDARDAILQADVVNNGGANECLIWGAFAKRGMGSSAQDGGSSSSLNVTEAFDLPPQCVAGCGNGVCEPGIGEDCNSCPGDCPGGTSSGAVCGNGVCEAGNGEDCVSCAADCNGKQNGNPNGRFCCGDGDGQNPVSCGDSRCTTGGFQCTDVPVPGGSFCCGDFACDAGESCSTCSVDCTIGAEVCTGGIDEDCDGFVDCLDSDCDSDPACQVTCDNDGICEPGEDCLSCSNDCEGRQNGNPANRFCCGDGIAQSAEGGGAICDGNF